MRFPRFSLPSFAFGFIGLFVSGQQIAPSVLRDPQAVAILQQSYTAMGRTVPNDSVANGTLTVVAGSLAETGSIQILTRGTKQSLEQVTTPTATRSVVFSQGQANEQIGTVVRPLYLERAASSESALFPLVLVADALNNPDAAIQYVGAETLNGVSVIHIRTWNTYTSQPDWQGIAEFTMKDMWFDSKSALPVKLSYMQCETGGNSNSDVLVEVFFSGFQNFTGVMYPSSVAKWLNGTLWMKVQINSVNLNTGLTDANFPIVQVTP